MNNAFCDTKTRLTSDFYDRNEDAASMGHFGAWCNAFVYPSLVSKYYCLKHGKDNFEPEAKPWGQNTSRSRGAPTSIIFRMLFCLFLGLLLFYGRGGRFIATCMIFGTMAIPTEMIGYTRYVPWSLCTGVFVVYMLYTYMRNNCLRALLFASVVVFSLCKPLLHLAYYVDNAYAVEKTLRKMLPRILIPCDSGCGVISAVGNVYSGNLKLLLRQARILNGCEMQLIEGIQLDKINSCWLLFPCNGFATRNDCPLLDNSE